MLTLTLLTEVTLGVKLTPDTGVEVELTLTLTLTPSVTSPNISTCSCLCQELCRDRQQKNYLAEINHFLFGVCPHITVYNAKGMGGGGGWPNVIRRYKGGRRVEAFVI